MCIREQLCIYTVLYVHAVYKQTLLTILKSRTSVANSLVTMFTQSDLTPLTAYMRGVVQLLYKIKIYTTNVMLGL